MQPLGSNDLILLVSLIYSCVDLNCEWEQFSTCHRPIHRWLLVSYACVITFRLTHLLGTQSAEAPAANGMPAISANAAADFLLDLRQKGTLPRFLAGFTWLVALPFFVFWTLLGTMWLWDVIRTSPNCVPSQTHLWFSGFWLALCYIWICVHIALGSVAWMLERRVRRAEGDLAALEDDETVSRWGNVSRISSYTALSNNKDNAGLSPKEIQALPGLSVYNKVLSCGDDDECECPVCINCFETGESLRTLRSCGHCFHRSCIDLWLLRRADCPLCKRSVRGETGEA